MIQIKKEEYKGFCINCQCWRLLHWFGFPEAAKCCICGTDLRMIQHDKGQKRIHEYRDNQ